MTVTRSFRIALAQPASEAPPALLPMGNTYAYEIPAGERFRHLSDSPQDRVGDVVTQVVRQDDGTVLLTCAGDNGHGRTWRVSADAVVATYTVIGEWDGTQTVSSRPPEMYGRPVGEEVWP